MANQDDYIKTALRLPRDLHAQLHLAAEKAGRSLNAELIARLEGSIFRSMDDDQLRLLLKTMKDLVAGVLFERLEKAEPGSPDPLGPEVTALVKGYLGKG